MVQDETTDRESSGIGITVNNIFICTCLGLFCFCTIASGQNSYLIVHAHNPEGVEIGSIQGMGQNSVQIFDGDTYVGSGCYNTQTHTSPISIPPGAHTIKAKFNGKTLEENINLLSGHTKVLIFTFPRITTTLTIPSFDHSWTISGYCDGYHAIAPRVIDDIGEVGAKCRLYYQTGTATIHVSASGSESEGKYLLQKNLLSYSPKELSGDTIRSYAIHPGSLTVTNPMGYANWFVQGQYTNGGHIALNGARIACATKMDSKWFTPPAHNGTFPLIGYYIDMLMPGSGDVVLGNIGDDFGSIGYPDLFDAAPTVEYLKASHVSTVPCDLDGSGIGILPPTCAEILNNAVNASLKENGKGLEAIFQPNYNKSLQEAAKSCGYDYFNWIQWVTYDDDPLRPSVQGVRPNPPYIDPPYGGYDYLTKCGGADYSPGYWNENGVGCSSLQLSNFTFSNFLVFIDYPTVSSKEYMIRFKTALIGVKNGGRRSVIGNWILWKCSSVGIEILRQNIDETVITSPGTTLEGIMPISELEPADLVFLADNGIDVDPYPCGYPPAGDFDEDCRVGISDLNLLAQNWLASNSIIDTNADNTINIFDLAVLADNWLIDCNISSGNPSCPIQ